MSKVSIREHAIPKIFIESENDFNSADHEIKKLCSINAPLRILITYTDKELLKEPGIGAYEKLRKWQSIVMSHHELNEDFFGVLGVVMARKVGDEIIFQACAFRNSGDLLRPLSVLASRNVG